MSETNKKMKLCTTCGKEIARGAKQCPHCGAKNKKPLYKKAWFIILAGIVVIGIISGNSGNDKQNNSQNTNELQSNTQSSSSTTAEKEKNQIEYTSYDVSQLIDDLEKNALSAEKKYAGLYVELTGRLSNIDSKGSYISLAPSNRDFNITNVQCYIKNEEQKNKVIEMSIGDIVILKGKIKSVGEVLGYSLDITEIK